MWYSCAQVQQPAVMAQEQPVVATMAIEFPEAIQKQIAANGVPMDAYTWTDEKVNEYIKSESARRGPPSPSHTPQSSAPAAP